jgi:hypothetical protein
MVAALEQCRIGTAVAVRLHTAAVIRMAQLRIVAASHMLAVAVLRIVVDVSRTLVGAVLRTVVVAVSHKERYRIVVSRRAVAVAVRRTAASRRLVVVRHTERKSRIGLVVVVVPCLKSVAHTRRTTSKCGSVVVRGLERSGNKERCSTHTRE